jgi:hypothetical protein
MGFAIKAAHNGDIVMASLLSIRLPKRVLATALAVSSEILLASFSLPPAAHAEAAANTRAGDTVLFVAADALDNSVLARQRGGRPGSIAVAAMPGTTSLEPSVTLWDELARPAPAPLPVPVDTTGTVQSNAVSYTRK